MIMFAQWEHLEDGLLGLQRFLISFTIWPTEPTYVTNSRLTQRKLFKAQKILILSKQVIDVIGGGLRGNGSPMGF